MILVPADETKEIRIFHKSFPDFLQDRDRCTNPRFHIDPETHHIGMAISCLELVKGLKINLCSLPPFTMNRDVVDLPQLLEDKVDKAMQYACTYWARYLRLSPVSGSHIEQTIILTTDMLKSSPLWIEVMSLGNHLEEVIHSMNMVLDWLDQVSGPLLQPNIKRLVY